MLAVRILGTSTAFSSGLVSDVGLFVVSDRAKMCSENMFLV